MDRRPEVQRVLLAQQALLGGGCLYDYAAHPVDLLTWYFGPVERVSGSVLGKVFSKETEDEVFSTLSFANGTTGQLSVSWSDESQRKMTTKVTIWGTHGRIYADRQEIQVFLRAGATPPGGVRPWVERAVHHRAHAARLVLPPR